MWYFLFVAMALTVTVPAALGLFRFSKLQRADQLFVVVLCLAGLSELLGIASVAWKGSNAESFNLYILAETVLLMIMFKRWLHAPWAWHWVLLLTTLVIAWIWDNGRPGGISNTYGFTGFAAALWLIILASCYIVFCNEAKTRNPLRHGRYIIAVGLVTGFSVKLITEAFFVADLGMSTELSLRLLFIYAVTNVLCNGIFVYGILCLSQKNEFILEYS